MAARIRDTSRVLPRIRDSGAKLERIDGERLARALGAKKVPGGPVRRGGPITLLALSQRIGALIHSSGGRPSLEGRKRRQKIPITDAEWERLEELADQLEDTGVKVSPGQVASVLLGRALEQVGAPRSAVARRKRSEPASES